MAEKRRTEFRRMQPEDLEQVAVIEQQCFSEPWSREGFASSLRSPDTLYLTALEDGQVVGYCGLLRSFEEADITNVAVQEDHRNQGIAEGMLVELMRQGREWGIERFTLEVRISNQAAIHVYEKLGFTSVGVRRGFYSKPKEDAVIMWLL